jgi:hypothetical protein
MKEGVSIDDLDEMLKRICDIEEKCEEIGDNLKKANAGKSKGDNDLEARVETINQNVKDLGK